MNINISLRQLQAFVSVARLSSFTRAAEEISITQAGLSIMIKEMEEQLGYRLFDRTTRAVWLTDAGERFLPVVTRALHDIEEAALRLARDEEQSHLKLCVAATPLVCATILPGVIGKLRDSHPTIQIEVRDVERPVVQQMVESGSADLGLGILFQPSAGLLLSPIHQLSLVCVQPSAGLSAPGGHPETAMPWTDLREGALFSLPAGNTIQQLVDEQLERIGRNDDARLTYQNMLTILGMVGAGLGCAVLPSFVRAACSQFQVRVTDLVKPRVELDLYVVSRRGVIPPAASAPFIEAFRQEVELIETMFRAPERPVRVP